MECVPVEVDEGEGLSPTDEQKKQSEETEPSTADYSESFAKLQQQLDNIYGIVKSFVAAGAVINDTGEPAKIADDDDSDYRSIDDLNLTL